MSNADPLARTTFLINVFRKSSARECALYVLLRAEKKSVKKKIKVWITFETKIYLF